MSGMCVCKQHGTVNLFQSRTNCMTFNKFKSYIHSDHRKPSKNCNLETTRCTSKAAYLCHKFNVNPELSHLIIFHSSSVGSQPTRFHCVISLFRYRARFQPTKLNNDCLSKIELFSLLISAASSNICRLASYFHYSISAMLDTQLLPP